MPENLVVVSLDSAQEEVVELTAIPLLGFELSLDELVWKWEKRAGDEFPRGWLDLKVSGTGTNLPDSLECKVLCTVVQRESGAGECGREFEGATATLKKDGGVWKLSAKIDALDAGLLGSGKMRLALLPTLPHAPTVGNWERDFKVPARVTLGEDAQNPLPIGHPLELTPTFDANLVGLSGFEAVLRFVEKPGDTWHELESFRWGPKAKGGKDPERRVWRTGTRFRGLPGDDAASSWSLSRWKTRAAGDSACEAQLHVSLDGGATQVLAWRQELVIRRPLLEEFEVRVEEPSQQAARQAALDQASVPARRKVRVLGKVAGLEAEGLGWGLEVTLWGARRNEGVDAHPAGATKGKPGAASAKSAPAPERLLAEPVSTLRVPLGPDGRFQHGFELWRLPECDVGKGCYPTYFATLGLDPFLTDTDLPAPVTEVMAVDAKRFRLVNPDDLMEHPADSLHDQAAVAACSVVPANLKIERRPHLASILPLVSGEDLTFEVHLAGSESYWKNRKVSLFVEEPGAQSCSAQSKVEADKDQPAPHLRVFRVPMSRADVFGRRILVTAEVDDEPPMRCSLLYDCAPSLENLHWQEQENGAWFLSCDAHFFPTRDGKRGSNQTLQFFFEEVCVSAGKPHALRMPVEVEYRYGQRGEGLPSKQGQLTALVRKPDVVRDCQGRVLLCAEGPTLNRSQLLAWQENTLPVLAVPRCTTVVKNGRPREVKCMLPFGKLVTAAFKARLHTIASKLAAHARKGESADDVAAYLMRIIDLETGGTFAPNVVTKASTRALGLIQFVVDGDRTIAQIAGEVAKEREGELDSVTLRRLKAAGAKTVKERTERYRLELAAMSALDQLERAMAFLWDQVGSRTPKGLVEFYLCVFLPAAVQARSELNKPNILNANPSLAEKRSVNGAMVPVRITDETILRALDSRLSEKRIYKGRIIDPATTAADLAEEMSIPPPTPAEVGLPSL